MLLGLLIAAVGLFGAVFFARRAASPERRHPHANADMGSGGDTTWLYTSSYSDTGSADCADGHSDQGFSAPAGMERKKF